MKWYDTFFLNQKFFIELKQKKLVVVLITWEQLWPQKKILKKENANHTISYIKIYLTCIFP